MKPYPKVVKYRYVQLKEHGRPISLIAEGLDSRGRVVNYIATGTHEVRQLVKAVRKEWPGAKRMRKFARHRRTR